MTYFVIQTLLLFVLAYLLGAVLGCVARKFFPAVENGQPGSVGTRIGTATAAAGAAAAAANRKMRESVGRPVPEGRSGYVDNRAVAGTGYNTPPITIPQVTAPRIPTVSHHIPVPEQATPVPSRGITWTEKTATAIPPRDPVPESNDFLTERRTGSTTFSTHIDRPAPPAGHPPAGKGADDLTRIKGLGSILVLKLNRIGIHRLDQVAAWHAGDIKEISRQLEFSGRIEREDWVGQAQRLLTGQDAIIGGTTAIGAVRKQETSFPSVQEFSDLDAVSSTSLSVIGSPDDLKRIAGVGVVLARQLNEMGYTHFEHIQNLTPYDIRRISERLEFTGRIEREDWMGQAERLDKLRFA